MNNGTEQTIDLRQLQVKFIDLKGIERSIQADVVAFEMGQRGIRDGGPKDYPVITEMIKDLTGADVGPITAGEILSRVLRRIEAYQKKTGSISNSAEDLESSATNSTT